MVIDLSQQFRIFKQSTYEGGKVVSHERRPPLPPPPAPRPQGHGAAGMIKSTKNLKNPKWNRTLDFTAYGAVSQQTALPRNPR